MKQAPPIIVLAQSKNWCAAIKRQFEDYRLSWVLDTDGLATEALEGRSTVAIVEIPNRNPEKTCLALSQLANHPAKLAIFAIGDEQLRSLAPLLQSTPCFAWYESLLQLPDLARAVGRHHSIVQPPDPPLEQAIWDNLPWSRRFQSE